MKQKLLLYTFLICLLGTSFPQLAGAQGTSVKKVESVLEKESNSSDIKLYPNPTSEYFQISNDESIKVISINNIIGKEVLRLESQSNAMHDISSLQKGMYIVRLLNKEGKAIKVVRLSKR
jgi:hypothetical protein